MALETPEMNRSGTFLRLSKKIWSKIRFFWYVTWGWTSSKISKGIQRKSKGNQRKCKGKSKEITGNLRECKGNFWKMPKPTENHRKIFFCPDFFLKVDGKLLIYPFLAFLAPSEYSSIEKNTPPEKNHSPSRQSPRSIIWDHNKMSESYQDVLLESTELHWVLVPYDSSLCLFTAAFGPVYIIFSAYRCITSIQ